MERIVIRNSFESLVEQLSRALTDNGYVVSGKTDYYPTRQVPPHHGRHIVLSVYSPVVYQKMLKLLRDTSLVLPCLITVAECGPGEVVVRVCNPTGIFAEGQASDVVCHLAREVARGIELIINTFHSGAVTTPDLTTSWG